MSNKPWVVKTPSGEIWGKIHRVIIDAGSRQIVSVDVMRGDEEGQFIRLPWRSLEVEDEDIVLGMSDEQVQLLCDRRPSPNAGAPPINLFRPTKTSTGVALSS